MLAISEKLPETSESIPLLGIYLTAVMAITSISVIMTVIVLNFHYRGPIRKEMPQWLKKFLLEKVVERSNNFPQFPQFAQDHSSQHSESIPHQTATSAANIACSSLTSHFLKTNDTRTHAAADATTSFTFPFEELFEDESVRMHTYHESLESVNLPFINEMKGRNSCYATTSKQANNSSNGANSSKEKTTPQEEMLRILRYLIWRQEIEDKHNKMVHEWRLLALAIDKVLFWVFLVITVTSSLSFLVIIPVQRRGFGFGFDMQ
ncbi:ligand-gated ion channel subunit-like protein [Dinothrombium tinctorium]|uniref:Ligand-gated ion channel subunit-like protein n=2 Tax=Dinothrombium tinctorium TaxID=1965070 RepID=A0A3S3PJT5_9ACAR|nr:ligand-gated ion channel subunit-like protein [Dinothrombium tinctorium]